MGTHLNAPARQHLLGYRAGGHQRGGEAAGKVAASPIVQTASALDESGVIPVAGPGGVPDGFIVLGVLVGVADHHSQRGPGGLALKDTGEHLHQVALLPGSCGGVLARLAPVQFLLHLLQIQLQPGGYPLQHHADGRAVGLPEDHMSHISSPPNLR